MIYNVAYGFVFLIKIIPVYYLVDFNLIFLIKTPNC